MFVSVSWRSRILRHWYSSISSSKINVQSTARASRVLSAHKMIHGDVFFLDEFADRQWDDPAFSGTMTCLSHRHQVGFYSFPFRGFGFCRDSDDM